MNLISAYMKPIHQDVYRKPNIPLPKVTGFYSMIPSPHLPSRFVFEVTYLDGEIDHVSLQSVIDGHCQLTVFDANEQGGIT